MNTPCAEGLASFSELLEVLCDLATGGAQQLRCLTEVTAGEGFLPRACCVAFAPRGHWAMRSRSGTQNHTGATAGGVERCLGCMNCLQCPDLDHQAVTFFGICVYARAAATGISGVSDNGQAALLAALTSLAHRAVAALGLSIGLSAEAPQGRTNIDPDAAYRAVCHVGIQLHFDHGVVSIARHSPAICSTGL